MAGEQTALILSGTSCPVNVVVNAIDSSGSHIALVIDTTTTRIDGKSTVPTVYYPSGSTGIAEIRFSLVTGVAEGDILILKVNGTAGGTAFSEYAIPVRVVGSSSLTSAETWKHDISLFTLLPSSYAGHKLVDIETAVITSIPANISALNDFDPAADTVANVTTVASVTNAVTTDTASRDASKADVSALATAASIAALNDFNPTTDTVANVTTVGSVTNAVTTDTASRDASKADVSALATAASIAALNDFDPATTQVDVGKINGDSTSASNLQKSTSQIIQGSVSVSNLTPTSSSFASSSITESTADHYKGRIVIFTSGNLSGQATDITAYSLSSGEGVFSVSQMTEAPSNSDTFVIV